MRANITFVGSKGDDLISVNGHEIQFGGANGDAYCFAHQSFECAENFSNEEKAAVEEAREFIVAVKGGNACRFCESTDIRKQQHNPDTDIADGTIIYCANCGKAQ